MSTETLACPRCGTALVSLREPQGLVFECAECAGHAEGVSVLRKRLEGDAVNQLWQRALSVPARRGLPCPSCRWPMAEVAFHAEDREAVVDACDRCLFVWFDAKERDALPSRTDTPLPLSVEAAEAVARFQGRADARGPATEEPPGDGMPRPSGWTRFPMDSDDEIRRWMMWILLAAFVLGPFLAVFSDPPAGVGSWRRGWGLRGAHDWGFVPADPWNHHGLTFLSSTFLATGRYSLFATLLAFFYVGWRVEARAGPFGLLALFLAGSVGGCLGHWVAHPGSEIATIGAAGPTTALYAWCLVVFPPLGPRLEAGPPTKRAPVAEWRVSIAWAAGAWAVVHWLDVQLSFWDEIAVKGGFLGGAIVGAGCGLLTRRLPNRASAA